MTRCNLQEQLTTSLIDLHAVERQAVVQMRAAPKLAGDEQIAQAFSLHLSETEEHERLIGERLKARDARPSMVKDIAGSVTGHGFGLFAALQPDTPGKLLVHAFSYEHMEEGAYDLLGTLAARADDDGTLEVARRIEAQEHAMGDRLEALFDRSVEIALRDVKPEALDKELNTYLADAHAIEVQSLQLLEKAIKLAEAPQLTNAYQQHLRETEQHERSVAARLQARGDKPSRIKDAALRLGALNWAGFFGAQPDTPTKLVVFTYALEHLEIGAYQLLRRVAERAGDHETVRIAERIVTEETDAARVVRAVFAEALEATMRTDDRA